MRIALFVFVSLITLTAMPAGLLMMIEPNGRSLGLSLQLLSNTPFSDFFIPGLILAVIVGGSSLVSLLMIMTKSHWSYKIALLSGFALVIWVIGELLLLPEYHWLQGLYLVVGILITLTSYHLLGKTAF